MTCDLVRMVCLACRATAVLPLALAGRWYESHRQPRVDAVHFADGDGGWWNRIPTTEGTRWTS